jgi:positive regulator of sigma E activity
MDDLGRLFLIGGLVSFLFLIIGIGLYILFSTGLYGLAKTEKTGNEWFSFVPILQLYIIGKILKEIEISTYTVGNLELVLPIAPLAVMLAGKILGIIPFLGDLLALVLNIAYAIFSIMVLYNFYKRYKGEKAVLMTVLSVILFFMGPIYIFNMRDSKPL